MMSAGAPPPPPPPPPPPHPPPGHRICLCNTVDENGLFGQARNSLHDRQCPRRNAVRVVGIREVLVDLIGDNPDAVLQRPLANGVPLLGRIHRPGWVGGGDKQQHFGAGSAGTFELLNGYAISLVTARKNIYLDASGALDRLG